jgi:small subunit ribosomal protein S7
MRRGSPAPRVITPDHVFQDDLVAKFINYVMRGGKKTLARRIVYRALHLLEEVNCPEDCTLHEQQSKVVQLFRHVIERLGPHVEVRSRRIGGSTYQIPIEVPLIRKRKLAVQWLLKAATSRKDVKRHTRDMGYRIFLEMASVLKGEGEALRMRDNLQKMARANQVFSTYRFS